MELSRAGVPGQPVAPSDAIHTTPTISEWPAGMVRGTAYSIDTSRIENIRTRRVVLTRQLLPLIARRKQIPDNICFGKTSGALEPRARAEGHLQSPDLTR